MKKFLILIGFLALVFGVTTAVSAEGTVRIDLVPGGYDMMGSGNAFNNNSGEIHQTGKLNVYYISYDGNIQDFQFGIDYGTGTDKYTAGDIINIDRTYDFNMIEYKFGARFLNFERVKLALMLSGLQIQLKDSGDKIDENATMLGCDVNWLINEKLSLDGYAGYSTFGGNYEVNGKDYDPAFIGAVKARINYLVAEHLALSLGFREVWCVVNDYKLNSKDGLWRGFGGFLVGVKYSF